MMTGSRLSCVLAALLAGMQIGACAAKPEPPTANPTSTPFPAATTVQPSPTAPAPMEEPKWPLEITYVDTSGFLIAGDGKKIIIDPNVQMPGETRERIEAGLPPFDEIDLILVTHTHSDHFDPELVCAVLEDNPDAVFASTQEAVEAVGEQCPEGIGIEERMRSFEPEDGQKIEVTLQGADLEILNLPHNWPITNLGFLFSLGGRRLLHTGDVVILSALDVYELPGEDIDIAFVPYIYIIGEQHLTQDGKYQALEAIQPERIIPIHLTLREPNHAVAMEEIQSLYPDAIIFRESMEAWSAE